MPTALITGAEGFTGRYLVSELTTRNYTTIGIGTKPKSTNSVLSRYEQTNLLDAVATEQIITEVQPDLVFHLAGISNVINSAESIYRVNLVATHHLLAALANLKRPPQFTLLTSTANLYGNANGILNEETPPAPQNNYAISKLAMEYMASIWKDKLPITVVRPFNYTGRGQTEAFLIPKLIKHFRERLPSIELGNINVTREFGDVRDVTSWYVRLAEAKAPWGPFNICSGIGYTLNQVINILHTLTGHRPEICINPKFIRANEVHTLIGSPTKLTQCIGDIFPKGLINTLRWMLE
ncbi:NAD-dependent epimerase/dehydratase family protein [Bilophila wadsworthia]